MSSAGIAVSTSNKHWKGTDYIERKLGSVLDRKVASSTKQVLLDRIQFQEATKPDPFYSELKNKYTPLNNSVNQQHIGDRKNVLGKERKEFECKKSKDELPTPKFILFEREKIQLHWTSVRRVGPGLFNLGNTCFLNSVIQVLTYTPPLVNYLATQEHSKTCQTVGFCMLCELQRHVLRTFAHNQNEAIKPMAIIQKLKYIAKHLRFGYQEDSHEFLRYVIDGMLKSCLVGIPEKLDTYTKGTTMVHQVFGGYYRSQVTCQVCHHTSNTYDPLMEILLDIKHAHSIMKALYRLTSVEMLNGDNMYLCARCKRKVPAKKHLTVHRPPNVLTVCLKRFDCHSLFGTKLNKEVDYPEQLNLRRFMSENQGPAMNYKLYAVLVHSGYSCNSGHYYCFIKAANNCWYQMNDSTVRQVNLKTVLAQQAYLLFYIRDVNKTKEQQHGRPTFANGIKTADPQGFNNKQNTPKVISERNKIAAKGTDKGVGQPVPRKPEPFVKKNNVSNKTFGSAASVIPLAREKVSFTLNLAGVPKKSATSVTEAKKDVMVKPEVQSAVITSTALNKQQEKQPNTQSVEQKEGIVGVNKNTSAEETPLRDSKATDKQNEASSNLEQRHENDKGAEGENREVHATTKWKVTTPTTPVLPPGGAPGTGRERTPSLSSDVSNACSITSKTGEWAVTDRSSTQDGGPRLPERQHAGWKVSTAEDSSPKKEKEKNDDTAEREKTPENVDEEEQRNTPKKRKHRKEKSKKSKYRKGDDEMRLLSDEGREKSEEEQDAVEPGKTKSSKRLRKRKKRKSSSVERESEMSSEGEKNDRKKKTHKKLKKKKKKKRRRSSEREDQNSGAGELSPKSEKSKDVDKTKELAKKDVEVETKDTEGTTKDREGAKKDTKRTTKDGEETKKDMKATTKDKEGAKEDWDGATKDSEGMKKDREGRTKDREEAKKDWDGTTTDSEVTVNDREGPKKDREGTKSFIEGTKVMQGTNQDREGMKKDTQGTKKVKECTKKDKEERRPLVQYSDHSSSEEENTETKIKPNNFTEGDFLDQKDSENKTKSRSFAGLSSPNGRYRDNNDKKRVVDELLEKSRGSFNYGCQVERWDNEWEEVRANSNEESGKRRRDGWDEEYDRGKVKRTKNRDHFRNRSYHGENLFQREYDRKRMKGDGWHYSTSSSSSRWHNRSSDRYSRRDRR